MLYNKIQSLTQKRKLEPVVKLTQPMKFWTTPGWTRDGLNVFFRGYFGRVSSVGYTQFQYLANTLIIFRFSAEEKKKIRCDYNDERADRRRSNETW